MSGARLSAAVAVDSLARVTVADRDAARGATTMVVVAGMHRSGTSALARSCNLLGVDLGDDFIPQQPDNRSGFWEDASVKDTDDLALASHGLVWDDVRPLPAPWRDGFGGDEVRARLRATLTALARRGPLVGVKDPRISRLLPLWLPLLDEIGVTPVFLIALREPEAVVRSLAERDGIGPERARLLWLRYTLEAERATRGRRRAFVVFDELLSDWRTSLARAARDADLAWPVPYDDAAAALASFLDPSLRHHVVAEEAPPSPLARLARASYDALRALRDGDATRTEELDRIGHAIAQADDLLQGVLAEVEGGAASGAVAGEGGTSVAGASDATGSATGVEAHDSLDTSATLDANVASAASAADAAKERARDGVERELDRARRAMLLAHELVWKRDRELETVRAERDALVRRVAELEAAVTTLTAQEADRTAERDRARHDVEVLRHETESLRAERDAGLRVIADVEASLSWRITAPLRKLSNATRRS